jgi:hypothetical protein
MAVGPIGLAVVLASARTAAAEPDRRSDAEVAQRLAFIEARLERGTPSATVWWSAWYYGYITVTIGQAGFAILIKDKSLRTDTAVGAAFSSVGVLGLGAFDFPARHAAADLARVRASTPEDARRKLAVAERLLAASARAEVAGRSWIPHVAGVAISLTSALVQAFAYKQVASGIVTLVSGVGITEAQVFTRPTAAIDDWRAYQAGAFASGGPGASSPSAPRVQVTLVAHPGGAGIGLSF